MNPIQKQLLGLGAAVIRILTILAVMTTPAAFAQVMYSVSDLGTLGGSTSAATCVNSSGQIAGYAYTTNDSHAFLWSGGNMTDLGTLPGGHSSVAYGINNSGQVVGSCNDSNDTEQAILYTGGTMTELGTNGSCANGINDSGQVVGWRGSYVIGWNGGGVGDLGSLFGGGYEVISSSAAGINNNGQIVGTASGYDADEESQRGPVAFLYSGGTVVNLGSLYSGPSYGVAINNKGQVVGNAAAKYTNYSWLYDAFFWNSNLMTDLGTLGTNNSSSANAINNNGQVVGKSGGHAFIWSAGRMTDLNSLIPNNSGWTLQSANGINDGGEIVGVGINPSGLTHAYLLFPNSHRATATVAVLNGSVAGATTMDGGSGYGSPPAVLIQGGGGTGATATAVVSNGFVVSITITDGGTGYTNPPSIYIYSPLGLQIGLIKAVSPTFSDLLIGTNYQLQVSSDLINWTNQGSVLTATNAISIYPQYWNVADWNQLFFRLQVSP